LHLLQLINLIKNEEPEMTKLKSWVGSAAALSICLYGANAALAQFSPVRPPIVPLITRSPYVSTWVTNDPPGSGNWPSFWNGNTKAITIMASVDGQV